MLPGGRAFVPACNLKPLNAQSTSAALPPLHADPWAKNWPVLEADQGGFFQHLLGVSPSTSAVPPPPYTWIRKERQEQSRQTRKCGGELELATHTHFPLLVAVVLPDQGTAFDCHFQHWEVLSISCLGSIPLCFLVLRSSKFFWLFGRFRGGGGGHHRALLWGGRSGETWLCTFPPFRHC